MKSSVDSCKKEILRGKGGKGFSSIDVWKVMGFGGRTEGMNHFPSCSITAANPQCTSHFRSLSWNPWYDPKVSGTSDSFSAFVVSSPVDWRSVSDCLSKTSERSQKGVSRILVTYVNRRFGLVKTRLSSTFSSRSRSGQEKTPRLWNRVTIALNSTTELTNFSFIHKVERSE